MFSSSFDLSFLATTLACLASFANAQAGPNTLSQYHLKEMTSSFNATYIVLPLPSSLVAELVAPKKLIPISSLSNLQKYMPNGTWPVGTHPVTVVGGYMGSIKQLGLKIPDHLMGGRIEVPCVDQLNDGKTCFRKPIATYVGGVNGQLSTPTIPVIVGNLEGTKILPGAFQPNTAALQPITNDQFFFETDKLILDNPISGPSIGPQAFQYVIERAKSIANQLLTELGFHFFISQPYIASNGVQCIRNEMYFNQTFANPFFCDAKNVTIYDYFLEANGMPKELAGSYSSGTCYSANGVGVGYPVQGCKEAIEQSGPAMDM